MSRATVAVLRTSPETVRDDYRRLLDLAGADGGPAGSGPVTVMPELAWHHYIPACSTPPWQLDGVLGALADAGAGPERVTVRYAAIPGVDTAKGIVLNRHHTVLEAHGIRAVLPGDPDERTARTPAGPSPVLDTLHPGGVPLPLSLDGARLVVCSTLKTHARFGVGGTLPTLFDALLDERRFRAGSRVAAAVAETLALAASTTSGMLAVMDGTVAGEGPGPHRLAPRVTGVIAASADPVALDAWAARMMGLDPRAIPHLRLAAEAGLGAVDKADIDLTGDDVPPFDPPFSAGAAAGWFAGTAAGRTVAALYDDWYWYVAVGEKHLKTVMKTGWGRQFEQYRNVLS